MAVTGVAVIGCGLIGRRRALSAAADQRTQPVIVVDSDAERAQAVGAECGAAHHTDWRTAVNAAGVGAVVVCTPNALLLPIASAALERGLHVLIEKPMGRSEEEAEILYAAAARSGAVLKIGFNHRYHPAIAAAHGLFIAGEIGELTQLRARYGHGSRPGCEREWRGDPDLAGGGELLDQGVHVIDLFQWFAGEPERVQGEVQTAVWPLGRLEDNAFGLMRFPRGVVGQMHVSMTQWKNLFSLEVHGSTGALVIDGLGGSYGLETLTHIRRNMAGGVPQVDVQTWPGPDLSWQEEWSDFADAMNGTPLRHGQPAEGLAVMRTVKRLYEAAAA